MAQQDRPPSLDQRDARLRAAQDRALAVDEGGADHFRGHPPLLDGDTVGKVADAGEGHEGDGDVGADPVLVPVPDRPHLQVVLGDPKALLDLPEPVVVGHHFGDAGVAQIGDDAGEPVPSLGLGDLLR
ncbi:MAG: hypothetical protein F4178_03875, partial [Rhodospirillaceae bacterium]|nr:hypothetical protein [Rhodospirillaceae bacterium]